MTLLGDDGSPRTGQIASALISGKRIVIATPVDGTGLEANCAIGYVHTVARLLVEHRDVALIDPMLVTYPSDVVRARSRIVRVAMQANATGVFWIDADTIPAPGTLAALLATGHDVVGCPYPRKRVHWDRVKRAGAGEEAEWHAYDYCYHFDDTGGEARADVQVKNGCVPVARMGFGCMYTSMRALRAVCDQFREDDWFTDVVNAEHFDCVAIFGLLFSQTMTVKGKPFRALYSEDYSFCERYAVTREARPELGLTPANMLVSHPASHSGPHLFRGHPQGLVYAR